ncbi:hypothetical protein [Rhizobium sp. CSW-27]|uniref:hypothetical protein n=1 Tax=Rhizobium sp. CSW-27 TaxID=2839985 RepID=UPI001C0259A4|nr:hypothetical protein [Rhizobium sp. CSW-27]MBT9370313.1 hypothetical protein [Rhizobium sp. CSW-27]
MTKSALVKAADLRRMADVAKTKNVTVWIEIDGRRIGISPEISVAQKENKVEPYEDFHL